MLHEGMEQVEKKLLVGGTTDPKTGNVTSKHAVSMNDLLLKQVLVQEQISDKSSPRSRIKNCDVVRGSKLVQIDQVCSTDGHLLYMIPLV